MTFAEHPLTARAKLLLAAEIALTYARVQLLLRGNNVQAVIARIRARRGNGDRAQKAIVSRQLEGVVTRILRPLPGDGSCLVRSLVLTAMLARRGIDSRLAIGVRTTPEFAAHAWVELPQPRGADEALGSWERLVEL